MPRSPWYRALLAISVLQVLGAAAGLLLGDPDVVAAVFRHLIPPRELHAIVLLALAGAGAALLVMGRGDRRAVHLGTFFFLLSSAYANRWLTVLAGSLPRTAGELAILLRSLQVDAFFPYVFWLFVRDFPRTVATYRVRRLLRWGIAGSLGLGIVLFGLQLLKLVLVSGDFGGAANLADVAPRKPSYEHYGPLMVSTLLALAMLFWKGRSAAGAERRRARLFAAALALALAPLFSQIVLGWAMRRLQFAVEYAAVGPARTALIFACLLSLPLTTAYAVLVHRVVGLRLLARHALQWALARGTARALIVLPFAVLALYLWASDRPPRQAVSGEGLLLVALCVLAGAAALYYRAQLLDWIDRRFFREQYDARRILTSLLERLRGLHDADELADLLRREVDRALHLEWTGALLEEPRSAVYVDPHSRGRRLDASSPLVALIAASGQPLEIDLEQPASPVTDLPEADRRWLAEHRVRLAAPIPAGDGSLLGALLLGAKRSTLPFLDEDKRLLRDVAAAAAIGFEMSRLRKDAKDHPPQPAPVEPEAETARQCPQCKRVYPHYTVFCSQDSKRLEDAQIPYVLLDRFRFERQIGSGGMGLVYRACDLSLNRTVAIKTLRRMSADHALRLRHEARTAARVTHPHLAGIYDVVTWQSHPMLILELLEGGTLGRRIESGSMAPAEMVELGIAMAGALDRLHANRILHRDVKPNNIGFTLDGVPKLMDFGIARMALDTRVDDVTTNTTEGPDADELPEFPHTPPRQLVGTLSYLSPEALQEEPPSPAFDLWGLCVVLYECLIGRKLFRGDSIQQVTVRILMGRVPELTDVREDAPEPLARFFRCALHRDPNRRPADAAALRAKLVEVRRELAAS